jgi:hypothetical protein
LTKKLITLSEEEALVLAKYALYLAKTYQLPKEDDDEDNIFVDWPELYQLENLNKLLSGILLPFSEETLIEANQILISLADDFKKREIMDVDVRFM